MRRTTNLEYVPEETAERIARITGSSSAYARALAECRARRESGEDVHLWRAGNMVLVGPDPAECPEAQKA